jgi:hypothetical protein
MASESRTCTQAVGNVHASRVPLAPAGRRRDPWRVWGRTDAHFFSIPFLLGQSRHRGGSFPRRACPRLHVPRVRGGWGGHPHGGYRIPACAGMTRRRSQRLCNPHYESSETLSFFRYPKYNCSMRGCLKMRYGVWQPRCRAPSLSRRTPNPTSCFYLYPTKRVNILHEHSRYIDVGRLCSYSCVHRS